MLHYVNQKMKNMMVYDINGARHKFDKTVQKAQVLVVDLFYLYLKIIKFSNTLNNVY